MFGSKRNDGNTPLDAAWAQIIISRVEDASLAAQNTADIVRREAEIARSLAAEDRERLSVLLGLLMAAARSNERIEGAAAVVASDLEASHKRANQIEDARANPGDAADAASKTAQDT